MYVVQHQCQAESLPGPRSYLLTGQEVYMTGGLFPAASFPPLLRSPLSGTSVVLQACDLEQTSNSPPRLLHPLTQLLDLNKK